MYFRLHSSVTFVTEGGVETEYFSIVTEKQKNYESRTDLYRMFSSCGILYRK